jgi:hypothetical protein
VPPNTLGKVTGKWTHKVLLYRGSVQKRLGKERAFAECHGGTRQSLLTVTWRRDGDFSLPRTKWHSAKSARQKVLGKKSVVDVQFTESYLPSVTLDKNFVKYFSGTRQSSYVR